MSHDPARQIARSARQIEDAAERSAYLDRVCRGITRLRADVDRILAEPGADEPVAPPAAAAAPAPATRSDGSMPTRADVEPSDSPDPGAGKPGDTIGRYRLVKELGQGGFGAVWLADQFQPVRRQVALKIIKVGMDTIEVVARFEQERQALALMDHPNVARVLDAGATASGRPYFVMDLVQGVPIHEFCDAERLSVRERLELFAQVCAAVQHAHMKGIIHRDLKPSNVLVARRDGAPHATVIDFGIAKATSSKLTERSLVTEAYQVIGTLQYMSPEQSQASPDIDTRADVYSLGVILYELMTGSTPYDREAFERGALAEILRMIAEHEPPPPSARITASRDTRVALAETRSVAPERLASQVRGELDWIVMRAIEKDRTRRYESAEALAADIRRYLTGEPVSAAPPSAAYRLRKLVRRHKGAVAAAAAVAASLVAGIVAFAWQASVAQEQRDDAVKARESESVARRRAEDVADFMETMFRGLDPAADEAESGSFKERLTGRLDAVAADLSRLDRDPLGRARLEQSFGSVRIALGDAAKAEALLRSSWEIRKRELGPDHPDTEAAAIDLAGACAHAGHVDEAVALVERVRERRLAAGGGTPAEVRDLDHTLGMMCQHADRLDRAIALFEAVWASWEAEPGPDTPERLLALHTLGATYRSAGRAPEAVKLLRDAHARRAALLGPAHPETLMSANSLAVALTATRDWDEAAKLHAATRDVLLERFPRDHPTVLNSEANLAGVLDTAGRAEEAVPILESVYARSLARHGAASPITLHVAWGLASARIHTGRHAAAVPVLEAALPPATENYGADNPVVGKMRKALTTSLCRTGRTSAAVAMLEQEAARASAARGPDAPLTLRLRFEVAETRAMTGDAAGAAALEEVCAAQERALGARHADTLDTRHLIGVVAFRHEDAEAAIRSFELALDGRRAALGADHPDTLESLDCLGAAFWMAQRLDRSVPLLEEAVERKTRVLGPDVRSSISAALNLAANYRDAGRLDDMIALLAVWLPRALAQMGLSESSVRSATEDMVAACQRQDRLGDAAVALEALRDERLAASGPDDPDVLRLTANLAACLWRAGRLDRSVPLYEDVVARRRRVFGADDPDTLMAVANLAVNLRDAGRAAEAVPLAEDTVRRARAAGPAAAAVADFAALELIRSLAAAGRSDEAAALARKRAATVRNSVPPGSAALAGELVTIGVALLDAREWAEAEAPLREAAEIRAKLAPDAWNLFNTRALQGEALLGLGRFAEAEPLVVGGCEGLMARAEKVPSAARQWIPKARDRVLRLYTAWHAAEPGKGHDAKLAEWKAKFEAEAAAPGGK